ncbi:MAG: tRNA 2-thiouridine(34) synthase MnmA [Bacillota bacterium]|jgi:tRNA-specific 2-thiouridylase
MKIKVLVAMSGGVDSTVTAALLLKQGYDVAGVTMEIGFGEAAKAAEEAARELGIEHYVVDLQKKFSSTIIKDFLDKYQRGKTPNPCVLCNKKLKFAAFWPLMDQLGCTYLATGHYVQKIVQNNRYILKKAYSKSKDQSYFLYTLSQDVLARAIFPLGQYEKEHVRQIARDMGLKVAEKNDSQDICFIPDGDYKNFYRQNCLKQPLEGNLFDISGNKISSHQGLPYYTVGQRKGLGVALGYPCYVVALDVENNAVIIGREEDLYVEKAFTCDNNFFPFDDLLEPMQVEVKVRYKAEPVPAIIKKDGDLVEITFAEKQKSIAPGQSAVFYQGDILVGGGCLI